MENLQSDTQLIHMLLTRLERISADSYWAHRASGVRGTLIRVLEQLETGQNVDADYEHYLTKHGFEILDRTAQEKLRKGMR